MKEFVATILGAGLIGFLPFINLNQQPSPAPAPSLQKQPNIQLKKSETKPSKRHRIQVQVVSINDLKVIEGDKVTQGQIISDRTDERQSLVAERDQIDNAIKKLSIVSSQLTELPAANFMVEEAAIDLIKTELELLNIRPKTKAPETFFRFKDQRLQKLAEYDKLEKKAETIRKEAENKVKIGESKSRLTGQLNSAVAALNKAKSNYQYQQYEHSLNLIKQQSEMQRQQYQIAGLLGKKQELEAKLRDITQIKSPVAGQVTRIKNLGQKDRNISLEVVIDVIK